MVDFSKVEGVEPTMRGVWFPLEDASYEVEIRAVRTTTQGGTNQDFFIVETAVIESSTESVKVGEARSWVVNMSNPKAFDAPYRDIKAFMCGALAIKTTEQTETKKIGEKLIKFVVGSDQPFATLRMHLVTTARKTDEGNDFTQHSWSTSDLGGSELLKSKLFGAPPDGLNLAAGQAA